MEWFDKKQLEIDIGTIHLRCLQILGGRGVLIANVCQLEGDRGLQNAVVFNF